MSSSFRFSFDNELLRRCSKYQLICLKIFFINIQPLGMVFFISVNPVENSILMKTHKNTKHNI